MKILVTGGAGFIGTNFCLYAKNKNIDVIALDNLSKKTSKKNFQILHKEGIRFIKDDIRKPLSRKAHPVDTILHLASHCSTPRSIKLPYKDFLDNALGTLNVLEFARKNGNIPVIYASTIKVYPDTINKIKIKESDKRYDFTDIKSINETYPIEKGGHSPYGCSKYTGDLYCQEYFYTYKLPTVINRMSTVYGPYQYGTEEAGWVYHFISSKKNKKPITIYGTGKQVRDCLFVTDLCGLFLKQIKNIHKIKGEVYNIGGGKNNSISLIELVEYLNKKSAKPLKLKYGKPRSSDLKVYISDLSKIKKHLNWQPKTSIYSGIDILYNTIT